VLASDSRAGSWARGRARTAQRRYVAEHWPVFSGFLLAALAVTIGCCALMPNAFMRGLVIGVALVAAPVTIWVHAVQVTGTAQTMMGDLGEQWTAQELRRLGRRGWRLVNHVALGADDIDHVLIGPGGAFAVETKWSASPWQSGPGQARQREAAAQARRNARSLGLWHPFKSSHCSVEPVVVLWGQGVSAWPTEQRVRVVDGVSVVIGPELRHWVADRCAAPLAPEQVRSAWAALNEHMLRRDPVDETKQPLPPSLAQWGARAGLGVGCAVAALLVFNAVLQWTDSAVLTAGAAIALATAVILPIRQRPVRALWLAVSGWTATLAILSVFVLAGEAVLRLSS
jgi:hypothetical protein